jgi:hypothetical protein
VQALIDPAVMVVAVIVPALDLQLFPKILEHWFPQKGDNDFVYRDSM